MNKDARWNGNNYQCATNSNVGLAPRAVGSDKMGSIFLGEGSSGGPPEVQLGVRKVKEGLIQRERVRPSTGRPFL